MTRTLRCVGLAMLLLGPRPSSAQSVAVTVPSAVSFSVVNVAASTTGSPNPMRVSFSNVRNFKKSDRLKISVKAETSTFSGPGTVHPSAGSVSWTASGNGGTGSNGTLDSVSYTQVYLSSANPNSGSVDLHWTLGSIAAAGLRAGAHTITVRWRFEVF